MIQGKKKRICLNSGKYIFSNKFCSYKMTSTNFIMLKNVKMPTSVDILTFVSRIES